MRRQEKQKRRFLGKRRFGHGNVKNRRGSGNRGGRGNAGLHKHRYSWTVKYDPDHFGKHGFSPVNDNDVQTVNLFEINQRALLNQLEKKGGKFYFEFDGKILGSGMLSLPVTIKARAWSKNCEEKVKKVGGDLVKFEK